MHIVVLALLIVAALLFLLAAIGVSSRLNLVAFGLLAWVSTLLVTELGGK